MPQGELKQPLASDKEVRQTIKQTLRKMEKDGIVYRKPIMDFTTDHREYEVSIYGLVLCTIHRKCFSFRIFLLSLSFCFYSVYFYQEGLGATYCYRHQRNL